jgi:tRNA C32,U32 (ribose-2'-O)-methylase TrmJ
VPLPDAALPRRAVLLLGREKEGIPPGLLALLDGCLEIPQLGLIRSLNVHVAGAITLYEYTRQQRSATAAAAAARAAAATGAAAAAAVPGSVKGGGGGGGGAIGAIGAVGGQLSLY